MLEVGRIDKAHGLRGEVIVTLTTDVTERLDPGSVLHAGDRPLTVRDAAPHQHRWRVTFEELASREDADAVRGEVLTAAPLEDADALWVHELIGATVTTADGIDIGTCTAVIANPAHDLLELDTGHLVPEVFVVSSEPGRIVVDLPDGLLEL